MNDTTKCRTCRAPITWATTETDQRHLPYDPAVVDHTEPDTDLHITTGHGTHRVTTAWNFADYVAHTARRRGWPEAQAGAFITDTFTAHRRHRCHQTPTSADDAQDPTP